MENKTAHKNKHKSLLHKKADQADSLQPLVVRKQVWKTLTALLLLALLFLGTTLFSHPTKSYATPVDITDTPVATGTDTPTPSPSPTATATPTQPPTPTPSPTTAPTPRPTPRPQPTATPIPTVGVTATVGTVPTAVPPQKGGAGTKPSPVPTKQPTPTPTPTATAISTPPPAATSPIAGKKTVMAMQNLQNNSLPVVPLVVGTLLTLCVCGVGLIGYRRVRTALLPAVAVNKATNEYVGRPWQRVRTQPRPIAPGETTIPLTALPESPALINPQLEGPRTGPVRRLSRVRLQKLQQDPVDTREKEVQ